MNGSGWESRLLAGTVCFLASGFGLRLWLERLLIAASVKILGNAILSGGVRQPTYRHCH